MQTSRQHFLYFLHYLHLRHLLLLCLMLCAALSQAQIYKWVDGQGKAHFSDVKPEHQQFEEVEVKPNTYKAAPVPPLIPDGQKKVIMYATSWCGFCQKARNYFKANNIAYTEYDIEKDNAAAKRHKQLGAKGVPLILVGDQRMSGFSVDRFKRLYGS